MNDHYSDYLKKNISINDLEFNKVQESDKDALKKVRMIHIKRNAGFLVVMVIAFVLSIWYFVNFLIIPPDNIVYQIVVLSFLGLGAVVSAGFIYNILGVVKGIRRGVVLAASRIQEVKDNRNRTYQYVLDIFFEDTDQTLMSYGVDQEVFSVVQPGDGIIVVKIGRKAKVMYDPDRKGIMDVSNIKSGL